MMKQLVACIALGSLCAPVALAADTSELTLLEKQLNALGERITRLQDLTDVEIVQNAYGYYVDKAQWRSLADLFADDARLEIGGKGVFLGKERVFEYMKDGMGGGAPMGPRNGLLIDHQQFQCLPTIMDDGVTAHARCIAFVMAASGWGHNYYEDTFVKENGVWKFKELRGPFNMYSGYRQGWVDGIIQNTFPEKFAPYPDLPPSRVYLAYPNYHVEPFHYPNPVTGKPMPEPSPRAGGLAFGR